MNEWNAHFRMKKGLKIMMMKMMSRKQVMKRKQTRMITFLEQASLVERIFTCPEPRSLTKYTKGAFLFQSIFKMFKLYRRPIFLNIIQSFLN